MGEMPEPGSSFRPNPQVVARQVGDKRVLVHLETNRIFALNETAGEAWDLLGKGLSREQIRAELMARFSVSRATLESELDRVLSELQAEGLVVQE